MSDFYIESIDRLLREMNIKLDHELADPTELTGPYLKKMHMNSVGSSFSETQDLADVEAIKESTYIKRQWMSPMGLVTLWEKIE